MHHHIDLHLHKHKCEDHSPTPKDEAGKGSAMKDHEVVLDFRAFAKTLSMISRGTPVEKLTVRSTA